MFRAVSHATQLGSCSPAASEISPSNAASWSCWVAAEPLGQQQQQQQQQQKLGGCLEQAGAAGAGGPADGLPEVQPPWLWTVASAHEELLQMGAHPQRATREWVANHFRWGDGEAKGMWGEVALHSLQGMARSFWKHWHATALPPVIT